MRLKTGIAIVIATVFVFAVVVGLYQASWKAPPVERPEEYIVRVSVIDKHTKRPVDAMIDIEPQQNQRTGASAILMSRLTTTLEGGLYSVEVTATNYRSFRDIIRVDRDINVTVELEPV